jgi:carboxypeptidase Q
MRRLLCVAFVAITAVAATIAAEERVDDDVYWKIRREATTNSKILQTVHTLTDVYGSRLTGSPALKSAGEWVIQQMHAWGLKNGTLEPWDFGAAYGRPGWTNDRLSAHIVAPVKDALVVEALAWTPGTNGAVRAQAVRLTLPQRPTKETLAAELERARDAVRGNVVLVGPPRQLSVAFNPPALRRDDAEVLNQLNTPTQQNAPQNQTPQQNQNQPPAQNQPQNAAPRPLTNNETQQQLNAFLVSAGAVVRVNDAGRDLGQIRAFGAGNGNSGGQGTILPPTVVMRNEDYGRIWRLLADGRSVELEFDILNTTYPEGRTAYNVSVEIPGTDKADEVVMLGGHLDSWHAATGATDNAVGCAVTMEAARILAAIGVKPRRTIRLALWSGEEQGLFGSQAYVREHFGMFEDPKPAHSKFAGYVNIDSGTGRVRAMTVFGPPAAATILADALAPLRDLGVLGATTTRSRARASSDHSSFNEAGLPGINVTQDPIQYDAATWHTNLDTYERIVEDDVKKSAITIAAVVYHLAMRDEQLPRFTKSEMPRRPQQPQTPAGPATAPAQRTN